MEMAIERKSAQWLCNKTIEAWWKVDQDREGKNVEGKRSS